MNFRFSNATIPMRYEPIVNGFTTANMPPYALKLTSDPSSGSGASVHVRKRMKYTIINAFKPSNHLRFVFITEILITVLIYVAEAIDKKGIRSKIHCSCRISIKESEVCPF